MQSQSLIFLLLNPRAHDQLDWFILISDCEWEIKKFIVIFLLFTLSINIKWSITIIYDVIRFYFQAEILILHLINISIGELFNVILYWFLLFLFCGCVSFSIEHNCAWGSCNYFTYLEFLWVYCSHNSILWKNISRVASCDYGVELCIKEVYLYGNYYSKVTYVRRIFRKLLLWECTSI